MLEIADIAPDAVQENLSSDAFTPATVSAENAGVILRTALQLEAFPSAVFRRPPDLLGGGHFSAERLGVIVMQTQRIDLTEMLGFSLALQPYPVVALNGSAFPRPKLFTLLHELAHISLQSSGMCDQHEVRPGTREQNVDEIEHYCNQVAAAALMPRDLVQAAAKVREFRKGHDWTREDLAPLVEQFGASAEAVLLRLVSLGISDWANYRRRKPEFDAAYQEARDEQRRRRQEQTTASGPSYYVMKARDLGGPTSTRSLTPLT